MLKTGFTRRRILGAVVLYLGLWGLTQVMGSAQVRAAVAKEYLPGADCPRFPACECEAVAVAPFLVRARYLWNSGTLAGGGAKLLYAWFGPARVQLWEWDEIVF
jgi:hypothetical protein